MSQQRGDDGASTATAGAGSSATVPIEQLFYTQRFPDVISKLFVVLYFPIGSIVFLLRVFVGIHTFLIACLLRKSAALRSTVLRIMCAVLGIVVVNKGERDESARVLCANHVSILDHLAIDLVSPCLLPSVWDIPTVVRWCFGYVEVGASRGRAELVRQAKEQLSSDPLPLLAFPEGIITSGQKALLKFNTWAFEVSSRVQPIAVQVSRPSAWKLTPSMVGASWWTDLFFFFALPYTVIELKWLQTVEREENESIEDFSTRVAQVIATDLGVTVSRFDTRDAAEATKRWQTARETSRRQAAVARSSAAKNSARVIDPKQLDEAAMRIKQSHPTYHLALIRRDLDRTKNQLATVENIKNGQVPKEFEGESGKITLDSSSWKKIYDDRRWDMIETNRSKYMQRLQAAD